MRNLSIYTPNVSFWKQNSIHCKQFIILIQICTSSQTLARIGSKQFYATQIRSWLELLEGSRSCLLSLSQYEQNKSFKAILEARGCFPDICDWTTADRKEKKMWNKLDLKGIEWDCNWFKWRLNVLLMPTLHFKLLRRKVSLKCKKIFI